MTDDELRDDVRDMLRQKAGEVRVSDDAWEKIAARIHERPARTVGRRLALAGAAAAAVAGTVFVANLPGTPTSQVANPSTTEATATVPVGQLPAHVFAAPAGADAEGAARAYLADRTGGDVGHGEVVRETEVDAQVLFRQGPVASEVFLRRIDGRWLVDSAASDLVLIDNPVYEQGELSGQIGIEADGELRVRTSGPGRVGGESTGQQVDRLDLVPFSATLPGQDYVLVSAVLRTDDGVVGVSETWVTEHPEGEPTDGDVDPATPTGSHVAIWPATDSVGLAELQRQADTGFREDLLDPRYAADGFLAESLPQGETPTSYTLGEFQQGDNRSGEVPYTLSDGASGTILLRRTGGEGSVWYVTGATSDDLRIETIRREETHLVADVWSDTDGTLTWTGAPPVEVRSGQTVSIGKPDVPLGDHPVVIRLMDGDRTLAITAQLG